jgi:exopolysaccharide biosynthesis predicted pyruvyltransferase EpsI
MGCYREVSDAEKRAIWDAEEKVLRDLQKDANDLTVYLCAAGKMLTKEQLSKMPKGYLDWKKKHDEFDRKRLLKEKELAAKNVIAKEKERLLEIKKNKELIEKAKRKLKKLTKGD